MVLRGSIHGPNYDAESVAKAMEDVRAEMPAESAASHGLIVDCSHGNSGKDEHRQAEVRAPILPAELQLANRVLPAS